MDFLDKYELLLKAYNNAYAKYSNFRVGAVIILKDERYFLGCNVENASYGATNCAERTAFFDAIKNGKRNFSAICIVGGKDGVINDYCTPCGICRQVMAEFCNKDFEIVLYNGIEEKVFKLEELLPFSFTGEVL